MVDHSKHIERAKSSLAKRQYDLVMQICEDCLDLNPAELEFHKLQLEAARRKQKEQGKGGFFGLGAIKMPVMARDPHKALLGQVKALGKGPEPKTVADVAGAAEAYYRAGNKGMAAVAAFYYDEVIATGLFLAQPLEGAANFFYERFKETKDVKLLEKAMDLLRSLEKNLPTRADIPGTIKNWTAIYSMQTRNQGQGPGGSSQGQAGADYRSQVANASSARRAEVMNKLVRTSEDAQEVLAYLEADVTGEGANDKSAWLKKGDIERRFVSTAAARLSFEKAKALDQHDFTIDKRMDELRIDEAKAALDANPTDQGLKVAHLKLEIECFRRWAEKQPLEMSHRYNLGMRLIRSGDIDGAAGEFQRAVQDSKLKRGAHRYLGYCFTKKNLLDLASQQYTAYLSLVDDDHTDEAKEVRYARARIFEDLGHTNDAITDYERLATIDLNYKDVATRLSGLKQA